MIAPPIIVQTGPVPDHLKTGLLVLILARCGWESLDNREEEASWRVASYDPQLSWDGDTFLNIPGWRSKSSNPYKDYTPADVIAWAEIPLVIPSRQL